MINELIKVVLRNEFPPLGFVIKYSLLLALLFASPHQVHSFPVQTLALSEILDVEPVFLVGFHVPDSEEKPLLVPSGVCVYIHKQVVLLETSVFVNAFHVATLKEGIYE